MASRGFLIRFIDIGLIVLFGFLMISDIEASSRVDLADARSVPEEEPVEESPAERDFVLVIIEADGTFAISDPGVESAEAVRVREADALEDELRRRRDIQRDAGMETVVLIQPDPSSLVQQTVDVMDACDRLGVAKSLRMDIEVQTAPDEVPEADTLEAAPDADSAAVVGGDVR